MRLCGSAFLLRLRALFAPVALFISLFVALLGASAQAQRPTTAGAPGNRDPFSGARERRNREAMLRGTEMKPGEAKGDPRAVEAAVEQVKEDFKRIQILRNELVRSLRAEGAFDYKIISEKTGEIHKRAHRLQKLLAVPNPEAEQATREEKPPRELAGAQLKSALVTLCKQIESFVENPVFKMPGVVNIEQSARASQDLEEIIHLSADIKKGAERLDKAARP